MGRGIAISPINSGRKQVYKVLSKKRSRGNIQGTLRSGDHKAADVNSRKAKLKQMAMAAKSDHVILQEKVYEQLIEAAEEAESVMGEKLNIAV